MIDSDRVQLDLFICRFQPIERKQGPRGVSINARAGSICLTSFVRHQSAPRGRLARFAQRSGCCFAAMSYAGAVASCSLWWLRTGAPRPLSASGRRIGVRLCSSGMVTDNISRATVHRILRVDHAGEYGANRIYAGQMAVLGRSSVGPVIQKMWDQEKDHLKKFNELMVTFRVRPTILMPFWNVVGFALGAGTALLGKEGAMACTVAVEESIAHHYNNQIRTLMEEDPEKYEELLQVIKKFRDEELEHHDTGLEHDAELAPAYAVLKRVIQAGCSTAIYLSERF